MSGDDQLVEQLISTIRATGFDSKMRLELIDPASVAMKKFVAGNLHHELGLAELFAISFGDLFMDVESTGQYAYSNGVWKQDTHGKRARRAIAAMIKRIGQAPGPHTSDEANRTLTNLLKRSLNGKGVITVADKFYHEQTIVIADVKADELDPHDDLLNTPDGVFNLRTGKRTPHDPEQRHTRMTSISPDFHMATPVWDKFLREITCNDTEVQAYLERLFGYFLTGETKEELFHIFYGDGGNGKTTLMHVLEAILGDYAVVGSANLFAGRHGEGRRFERPRLRGARAILIPEGVDGHRLDAAFVKEVSSPGNIVSEAKFKDFVAHRNTAKAAMSTNVHMKYGGKDGGIERRLVVVEFKAKYGRPGDNAPENANRDLIQMFRPELPGILAKAIIGAVQWYSSSGLIAPAAIRLATERYNNTADEFAAFLELCLETSNGSTIGAETLRTLYNEYARSLNLKPRNPHEMKQIMLDRGFHQKRTSKGHQWIDLTITTAGQGYLSQAPNI